MERRKKIQNSHAKNISSEITSFHNIKNMQAFCWPNFHNDLKLEPFYVTHLRMRKVIFILTIKRNKISDIFLVCMIVNWTFLKAHQYFL